MNTEIAGDARPHAAAAAGTFVARHHASMTEPKNPPTGPYGPRAPSLAEIKERSEQLLREFEKRASEVRAESRDKQAELRRHSGLAIPGAFEGWAIQKLARAELYLEYYGSLFIAIGKKFQQLEKK